MKKNKWLRWLLIIGVSVIVLLMIAKAAGLTGKRAGTEVEVSKVGRHTIIERVNASGKVQPEKEVKITADISGEIIELPVKEGDPVKKGQLLVKIKPDAYQRGVEKASAGVNTARANLANAKALLSQQSAGLERIKLLYSRNKKLFEQKAISTADFENTESEYNVGKAQLEAAEQNVKAAGYNLNSAVASLKEAQDALQKTSVFSPIDGFISKLSMRLGERTVGTMQMAGTEIMRVANLNVMQVEVDVNENDIVRLQMGDTADIEADAYRSRIFKGVVTEIASSAESAALSTEKVTNFLVKIKILEGSYTDMGEVNGRAPTPFRPGMSANVSIHTTTVSNALAIPILGVTVREDDGSRDSVSNIMAGSSEVVFVYKNGEVEQRKVETGIQDDTYIQVKKGLEEGEEIVSGPYRTVSKVLKDGQKVEKTHRKEQ